MRAAAKAAGKRQQEGAEQEAEQKEEGVWQKREANYNACLIMGQHNGANRTLKHGACHSKGCRHKVAIFTRHI